MATYKVIQDIEAEDKLVGPLSLRQFIYAAIVAVSGFIAFKLAVVKWWLVFPFIPHMVLFALLAAPFGHDQSSEIWLLAKIRFFLKPQKRIWDQSGLKELVTITVPKKIEKRLTDGLSQVEVKSRLQALANTIDSRGWVVKNVSVNMYAQPSYVLNQVSTDRLIDVNTMAQDVPTYDIQPMDDILDEQSNPTAQHLDQLITTTQQNRRQELMAQMQNPAPQPTPQQSDNYWFMNQPDPGADPNLVKFSNAPVPPTVSGDIPESVQQEFLAKQHEQQEREKQSPNYGHMRVIDPHGKTPEKIKPSSESNTKQPPPASEKPAVTAAYNPVTMRLASDNDKNVATLGREAQKARQQDVSDGEVVISLR